MNALRAAVRGFGELLITSGLVILLFCVYQLFYTNILANQAMDQGRRELEQAWREGSVPDIAPAAQQPPALQPGQGFALIHIPRLGEDYAKPVLEGVALPDLAKGIGHYPGTALPGQVGNFALAGHRATNGEPFRDLDRLAPGDKVYVQTASTWYVYTIDTEPEIVTPDRVDVILPVPKKHGVKPTEPLITLTTCHPRWGSSHRMIVYGHLESTRPTADGAPPELVR